MIRKVLAVLYDNYSPGRHFTPLEGQSTSNGVNIGRLEISFYLTVNSKQDIKALIKKQWILLHKR